MTGNDHDHQFLNVAEMTDMLNNLEILIHHAPDEPQFQQAVDDIRIIRAALPHINPEAENSVEILPFTSIALQRQQFTYFAQIENGEGNAYPRALSDDFAASADDTPVKVVSYLAQNPDMCVYRNFAKMAILRDLNNIANTIKDRGLTAEDAAQPQSQPPIITQTPENNL